MADDEIIDYPPLMAYKRDLDRLRNWGIAQGLGDSAVTLRKLLDIAESVDRTNRAQHKLLSFDELLALLDDIRAAVAAHDSFEGSIEYLMPGPLGLDENADFAVLASYRVGNSMGQGGVVLIRAS